MNNDNTNKLITKYPKLFAHYSFLECDDGWYDLIDSLSWQIDQHTKYPEQYPKDLEEGGVCVVQIKEKFGTLRYYINQQDAFINGLIVMAESISSTICEVCGEKGKTRKGGWIKTLCEQHHLENQQRKIK